MNSIKPDLKLKFKVAILRHVAAQKMLETTEEDKEIQGAPGMSFFTAVR